MNIFRTLYVALVLSFVSVLVGNGFVRIIRGAGFPFQNKEQVTQTTMLNDFNDLQVDVSSNIKITKSEENKIEITGQSFQVNRVKVLQNNMDVSIDTQRNQLFGFNTDKMNIVIHTTQPLEELTLAGNIDVEGSNFFAPVMILNLDGSIDAKFENVTTQSLKTVLNGSSNLNLDGNSPATDFRINGSSEVNARGLLSEDSSIVINGSGDIELDAKNTLNTTINGSGDIRYSGTPQVNQTINGSGEIRKID